MVNGFDLQRFVDAQNPVYSHVLSELVAGQKRSHWMFIFPQAAGLGHSAMAQAYAIGSRGEAQAYLAHPLLGPRLQECTVAVRAHSGRSARHVFGSPDDMKFRSSMTLFEAVSNDDTFTQAIDSFYGGQRDQATLNILAAWTHSGTRAQGCPDPPAAP